MSKILLNIFIVIAFILILFGFIIAFIDLTRFDIRINNDGYVGAILSLAGIILFFTALMYQIKEYHMQAEELKKSVKAQTKSSEALDEQKRLLIEQNTNTLIFGMINGFNDFKERNNTQEIINEIVDYYKLVFALKWKKNLKNKGLNKKELNERFANDIKETFSESIIKHEYYSLLKRYIQFIYNIFFLIDINKKNISRDNFTPFFYSQLNSNETIILYLSNLMDSDMPKYENLHWGHYSTKEIVDKIKEITGQGIDYEDIDCNILTQKFKELKQNS